MTHNKLHVDSSIVERINFQFMTWGTDPMIAVFFFFFTGKTWKKELSEQSNQKYIHTGNVMQSNAVVSQVF